MGSAAACHPARRADPEPPRLMDGIELGGGWNSRRRGWDGVRRRRRFRTTDHAEGEVSASGKCKSRRGLSTFQDGSRAPRDRWSAGLPPAISLEPRAIPPDQRQAMLPSRPPTIIRRGRWVRRPPQVCAVRAGLPNRCSTRACCAWAPACDEDTRVPMHSQTSAERGGGCLKCAKLCARARAGQNPTVRALASETGERRRACRAS